MARIRSETAKALEDPETKRKFVEEGLIPIASTPQEFGKAILDEIALNRRLVERIGLKPQ